MRSVIRMAATCVALIVAGCGSPGGGDAAMLADSGVVLDATGLAPTGVMCGAMKCGADQFCIEASSGAPGGPAPMARCQAVAECASTPTCECFSDAFNDCHGWGPGGTCWVAPDGIVRCQSL